MKKNKRLVSTASSTSDSSEDVPIAVMQKRDKGLLKYEKKACEFCDKVFYNQYDIHIHNAKHIIIPLIKHTVYQCTVCLFHFTSIEELQFHSAVKHDINSCQLQKILDETIVSKNTKKTAAIAKEKAPENVKKTATISKEKAFENEKKTASLAKEKTSKNMKGNINITKVACDNSINTKIESFINSHIESIINKRLVDYKKTYTDNIEKKSIEIQNESTKTKNGSAKIGNERSKTENGSTKIENRSTKFENGSTKIENSSTKIENRSTKIDNGSKIEIGFKSLDWTQVKKKNNIDDVKGKCNKPIVKDKYNKPLDANVEACTLNGNGIAKNLNKIENKTNHERKHDNVPSTSSLKSKIVFEDDSDLEIYDDDVETEEIPLISKTNIKQNGKKDILSSNTFTQVKEPLKSNQSFTPNIKSIQPINSTFTRTNNLIQMPLLNQQFNSINNVREMSLINPSLNPVNSQNVPINKVPYITNNFIGPDKRPEVVLLDLCSDDDEGNNEDYILPDEGDLDTRLFVPDLNYILPDCGPLLPVPPIQTQPHYGKIMLGNKVPQTTHNSVNNINIVPKTFVPRTLSNYTQNHNTDDDATSKSTPMLYNMLLSNEVGDNVNGSPALMANTIQPALMANTSSNKFFLGTKPPQYAVKYTPSLHYDDLMSPGLYMCKRCKKKYPTRFELISHETSHITMKTEVRSIMCKNCPICDRYITGGHYGMMQHRHLNHKPNEIFKSYTQRTCTKCNLMYRNVSSHEYNYHKIYVCQRCGHRFEKEEERFSHMRRNCVEAYSNTTLKVCELCVMFLHDKHNIKYVVKGEFSEVGKRQICMECGKEFFELKVVERILKHRKNNTDRYVKKLSNNERLKNIQNRLKNFNKLSR